MNYLTENKNPWKDMEVSTQRRVDVETQRDFFWMTDLQGNYGFYLKREKAFEDAGNLTKLKGISILKRNSDKNGGEFFLILNQKEDWQIFHTLCEDLITATHKSATDEKMFSLFEARLKRWENLLKNT